MKRRVEDVAQGAARDREGEPEARQVEPGPQQPARVPPAPQGRSAETEKLI